MMEIIINGMVSVQRALQDAGAEVVRMVTNGPVELIIQPYDEKATKKRRSTAQNRLIYKIYQRIAKTLYGGDESHARNECKLKIGCRILYRERKEFADLFDRVIRPLDYETKLSAMNLVSVSSIMETTESTEYIKVIMQEYGARQVYFMDLEGTEAYLDYKENQ